MYKHRWELINTFHQYKRITFQISKYPFNIDVCIINMICKLYVIQLKIINVIILLININKLFLYFLGWRSMVVTECYKLRNVNILTAPKKHIEIIKRKNQLLEKCNNYRYFAIISYNWLLFFSWWLIYNCSIKYVIRYCTLFIPRIIHNLCNESLKILEIAI